MNKRICYVTWLKRLFFRHYHLYLEIQRDEEGGKGGKYSLTQYLWEVYVETNRAIGELREIFATTECSVLFFRLQIYCFFIGFFNIFFSLERFSEQFYRFSDSRFSLLFVLDN
jgi:hypothetical protein